MPVCERHGIRQKAAALPAKARAVEKAASDVFIMRAMPSNRYQHGGSDLELVQATGAYRSLRVGYVASIDGVDGSGCGYVWKLARAAIRAPCLKCGRSRVEEA